MRFDCSGARSMKFSPDGLTVAAPIGPSMSHCWPEVEEGHGFRAEDFASQDLVSRALFTCYSGSAEAKIVTCAGFWRRHLRWRKGVMRIKCVLSPAIVLGILVTNSAFAVSCADIGYGIAISDATVLNGRWVTAQNSYSSGPLATETWQEDHCSTSSNSPGDLIKRAAGPGDAVDPTKTVGTWTPNPTDKGMGWVRYNYGGPSVTYDWKLYRSLFTSPTLPSLLCWEDSSSNFIATGTTQAATYCGP